MFDGGVKALCTRSSSHTFLTPHTFCEEDHGEPETENRGGLVKLVCEGSLLLSLFIQLLHVWIDNGDRVWKYCLMPCFQIVDNSKLVTNIPHRGVACLLVFVCVNTVSSSKPSLTLEAPCRT